MSLPSPPYLAPGLRNQITSLAFYTGFNRPCGWPLYSLELPGTHAQANTTYHSMTSGEKAVNGWELAKVWSLFARLGT